MSVFMSQSLDARIRTIYTNRIRLVALFADNLSQWRERRVERGKQFVNISLRGNQWRAKTDDVAIESAFADQHAALKLHPQAQ
jgi:hypothetical protein